MLTKAKGSGFTVTACEFSDLPDLFDGRYTSPANLDKFQTKVEEMNRGGGYGIDYGGIRSMSDAVELLNRGWNDGAKQVTQLSPGLANVVPPPRDTKRRVTFRDEGSELHLDRALSGQWETAWRTTRRQSVQTPRVVSLGCAFGGHAGLSHSQLFWCAAQMIVATDMLENAGYAVELHALKVNQVRSAHTSHLIDVLVKRPDQPLRPDAVAAVFGHAGVYRTAGHMLIMTSEYNVGSGLGHPVNVSPILAKATQSKLVPGVDYVLEMAYNIHDATVNLTNCLTTITGNATNE